MVFRGLIGRLRLPLLLSIPVRDVDDKDVEMKKLLDLVRLQRGLLDSQRGIILEHRRALDLALGMLANVTGVVDR